MHLVGQKRRSESPTHAVLMQLSTMLQIEYGCLFTLSHIPSILSIEAGGISRRFQVPNDLDIREHSPSTTRKDECPTLEELGRRAEIAQRESIHSWSGRTYRTGEGHWLRFENQHQSGLKGLAIDVQVGLSATHLITVTKTSPSITTSMFPMW